MPDSTAEYFFLLFLKSGLLSFSYSFLLQRPFLGCTTWSSNSDSPRWISGEWKPLSKMQAVINGYFRLASVIISSAIWLPVCCMTRGHNLNTLFKNPEDIRRANYITNAIEYLNSVIRKVIKKRKLFPTDDSAKKVVYLAIKKMDHTNKKLKIFTESLYDRVRRLINGLRLKKGS